MNRVKSATILTNIASVLILTAVVVGSLWSDLGGSIAALAASLCLTIAVLKFNDRLDIVARALSTATMRLHAHGDQIDLRHLSDFDRCQVSKHNHPAGKAL